MELQNICHEIYNVSKRLDKASRSIYKLGEEKADTERIYRMRLAQEMLELKSGGMAATMVADVARGNVSDLLFQRDAAEAKFKAGIEALEAIKAQLSALQSILRHMQEV